MYVLIVCSYDGHSMILRVLFEIRNVYGMLRKALKCVVWGKTSRIVVRETRRWLLLGKTFINLVKISKDSCSESLSSNGKKCNNKETFIQQNLQKLSKNRGVMAGASYHLPQFSLRRAGHWISGFTFPGFEEGSGTVNVGGLLFHSSVLRTPVMWRQLGGGASLPIPIPSG